MSKRRGFCDQTLIFGPIVENTIIYKLCDIQYTEVKINWGNIEIIKNKLYGNYRLCFNN